MRKLLLLVFTYCLIFSGSTFAQQSPQEKGLEVITTDAIKAQLEFLASDWTEGREAGTRGMYMASDYIASMFKYSGVPGGGDISMNRRRMSRGGNPVKPQRSYFQDFTLLETLEGGESDLKIQNSGNSYVFQEDIDYIMHASSSADVTGDIVFVGYGIQSDEFGINELAGADLKGKIVLRLSGLPGMGNQDSEIYKKLMADRRAAYTLMRSRDRILREKGVVAVIEVNPGLDIGRYTGEYIDDMDMSPNESSRNSEFVRLRQADNELSSGMVTVTGGNKVITSILKNSRIDLEEYIEDANEGLKKFKPLTVKGCTVSIKAEVKKRRVRVRNVVAMIEGKKKDEFVVIGAHMDHMGMSGGRIWNGADDNASGTVGVMTIARAFAATGVQPERTVIFCGWTAEEKGLLGSEYFTQNPVISSMDNCKFYINFDMIARNSEEDEDGVEVGVTYNNKYPELLEMCESNVSDYDLKMKYNFRGQEDPTGGSDYTAFTQNGVPIIAFMAAMHPDYHAPSDEVDAVNWEKMLDIIKLGFLNLWEKANE